MDSNEDLGIQRQRHKQTHTNIYPWLKTDKHKVKLQLIASIVEKCQQHQCNPAGILERIIPDIVAGLNKSHRTIYTLTQTHSSVAAGSQRFKETC